MATPAHRAKQDRQSCIRERASSIFIRSSAIFTAICLALPTLIRSNRAMASGRRPARSANDATLKRCHRLPLHRSLNGSGLIAEYRTVFVILAWPR